MTLDIIEFVEGFLEASSSGATKRPVLIEIAVVEVATMDSLTRVSNATSRLLYGRFFSLCRENKYLA